jgi:hypothetical protein
LKRSRKSIISRSWSDGGSRGTAAAAGTWAKVLIKQLQCRIQCTEPTAWVSCSALLQLGAAQQAVIAVSSSSCAVLQSMNSSFRQYSCMPHHTPEACQCRCQEMDAEDPQYKSPAIGFVSACHHEQMQRLQEARAQLGASCTWMLFIQGVWQCTNRRCNNIAHNRSPVLCRCCGCCLVAVAVSKQVLHFTSTQLVTSLLLLLLLLLLWWCAGPSP